MTQTINSIDLGNRDADQWLQMGTGETQIPQRRKTHNCDVAVLGGGQRRMD